ncbi:MAG TPA: hypothetical protein VG142_16175 [Trebonia sp.]|nr:hypothetical protein [Trebonia sp.]
MASRDHEPCRPLSPDFDRTWHTASPQASIPSKETVSMLPPGVWNVAVPRAPASGT